jgi:hypothetical protein
MHGITSHNVYLSFLNLSKEVFLKGTFELKIMLNKTFEKFVRPIFYNTTLKILIDNNEIESILVNKGDIVILYISKINIDFLIVNYG